MSAIEKEIRLSSPELLRIHFPLLYANFTYAEIPPSNGKKDAHRYILNSLTDHVPATRLSLVRQTVDYWSAFIKESPELYENCKIISETDKGGYLMPMTLDRLIPEDGDAVFSIASNTHVPNDMALRSSVKLDYEKRKIPISLNDVNAGDITALWDDMIDSGSTMIEMINLIRKNGAEVRGVTTLSRREEAGGIERIEDEVKIKVKTPIKLKVTQVDEDSSGKALYKCDITDCWIPSQLAAS